MITIVYINFSEDYSKDTVDSPALVGSKTFLSKGVCTTKKFDDGTESGSLK